MCLSALSVGIKVGNFRLRRHYDRDRKGKNMEDYVLISDAAKEVEVESHVLRYWEEELTSSNSQK